MTREIKESDWKIFRQLHPLALERFCERVLFEIKRINSQDAKSFHQRYLDIYAVLGRRDNEMAQVFDDFRRSTALIQLAAIKARGLLTEEEFSRFSQDTRTVIEVLLGSQDA